MTAKITDVAVAIFEKPDGRFLLSSRPEGKPYPHYWEFPGGKIEPGEDVYAALVRELIEELNVTITHATPWFAFIMRYTHATVRLHCWRVQAWQGNMRGLEGQHFEWQSIGALTVSPTLPGCVPIFAALRLPRVYAITNAGFKGVAAYREDLAHALQAGVKLIQVREKNMSPAELRAFARDVVSEAHSHGAKVLINSDAATAADVGADGVHLTAAQLAACTSRPDFPLVAASTHTRAEIERAGELGLDFVVLGPVNETLTHPDQVPIGWPRFGEIINATPVPVFALGGLALSDMNHAIESGAHGIAAQRAFS